MLQREVGEYHIVYHKMVCFYALMQHECTYMVFVGIYI